MITISPQAKYQRSVRLCPLVRQAEAEKQRAYRALPAVRKRLAAYYRLYRHRNRVRLRAYDRERKARAKEIARQQALVDRGLLMKVRV